MGAVIKRQGGSVLLNQNVEEILVDQGKASGVKLSDGRTVKSDIVVSNADPGWTYKNLIRSSPVRQRSLDRKSVV